MHITARDIACYLTCPMIQYKKKQNKIFKDFDLSQKKMIQAIVTAEHLACLKNSIVSTRKILRCWEKIWWPAASENGLSMKEAEKISLSAGRVFSDYCKYDVSDWMMPTLGTNIEQTVNIAENTLSAACHILKVDLQQDNLNTVVVNFVNRNLDAMSAALDPAIRATAYNFYTGKGEIITHLAIKLTDNKNPLELITSTFDKEEMQNIEKMIYHTCRAIRSGVRYYNTSYCKECKLCRVFL